MAENQSVPHVQISSPLLPISFATSFYPLLDDLCLYVSFPYQLESARLFIFPLCNINLEKNI